MSGDDPRPRWLAAPLPADEPQRLAALREYEILDTGAEAVFDDLVWLATQICETPIGCVTLIDADRQWCKARVGISDGEMPRNESFCAHSILGGAELLEIPDTATDDRFAGNPLVTGSPFIRFYAGAPLISATGFAVGALCVSDRRPRVLTDPQREGLRILAAQVVSNLELRRRLRFEEDRVAEMVSVLNAVPCAVIVRSAATGELVLRNLAAARHLPQGDVDGQVLLMDKKGRPLPRERWPGIRALAGEHLSEEMRIRTADGVIPVIGNAAPVRDSRGTIVAAAIAYQDITPLTEVSRLKDEFVATVSHELRTPLTAIKGSLQLVHADDALDPDHRELIGVALNSADRLVRLVNDMLDTAKIEAGALKLQRRTVTVESLGRSAFENVRPIAAAAGVRLAIDVEPGVRDVHVDVDRMVQALVNLLSNAIKFAPRATTVTITGRRLEDGGVSMSVHDQGAGIPPERLSRLFEKFWQLETEGTNQGKGTGLGLPITKAIVEEHGGTIHVVSNREEGTTFEIRLYGDGTSFAPAPAIDPSRMNA